MRILIYQIAAMIMTSYTTPNDFDNNFYHNLKVGLLKYQLKYNKSINTSYGYLSTSVKVSSYNTAGSGSLLFQILVPYQQLKPS